MGKAFNDQRSAISQYSLALSPRERVGVREFLS